ncbi:efflux RND transporter permease subunit, partial [Salmonella enterica]|uniref:efflux RND transporter permease subunit n=1 Tax=Salmonella enterica TaxID=28901 RepID=UPI00398C63BB
MPPPHVPGLGGTGGFKLTIEGSAELGFEEMTKVQSENKSKAMQTNDLANMMASFETNTPKLKVAIDRVMAKSMRLSLPDVFDTLQVSVASLYVTASHRLARALRQLAQPEAPLRPHKAAVARLNARNAMGQTLP